MDFELTESQQMLKETARRFADTELAPMAYEIDRDERFPYENFKKMADLGFLGITIPEEYGGAGGTYMDLMIVAEEISAVCVSSAVACGANADLFSDNLFRNGSETLRRRYLPPMCAGDMIGGIAMTEPEAGSDVTSMKTTAVMKGDHYVLNGAKTFITNGPVGDAFIVYAKTDPAAGAHGISAFVVERTFPGFSSGKQFEKMGWRGSPTGELIFEDCMVPKENLIGQENMGALILMSGLNTERLSLGAMSVGIARGAYEFSLKYAKERVQFGRPISSFQLIQDKLVTMAMEIEAARLLVYKGAALADKGERGRDANLAASFAKLYATEMSMRATTEAVQILGGYGFTREFPVERMMRDAKLQTIGGGTSEIQKLIAIRDLLR
ncbi:MAG: acyl-CoA dehydrogenase family protein [Deltaproteobacteria bacterium]|nr:acyl-CoA dehydrogenase family protein [Deltaproteobacteria bacterium]